MKKLKEKILQDNQLPTPSPTDRPTPSTSPSTSDPTPSTPSTPSHIAKSNDTYVYGVDILAVVAIGVCVFFAYNSFLPKIVNEKQYQTPKRRHML